MLKFRARGFLLRDAFGDVLKGMRTFEEVRDYVDADVEVVEDKPKQKLFKAKSEPKPEESKPEEPKQEVVDKAEQPKVREATQEQPKVESFCAELADRLEAEGLTQGQCVAYAGKNGMLVSGKIDEFAAQKILNAWDVVKGFIAREDAGDDI